MTELVSGMPAPSLGNNLREGSDQSRFNVQRVPYDVSVYPWGYAYPRLKTIPMDDQ